MFDFVNRLWPDGKQSPTTPVSSGARPGAPTGKRDKDQVRSLFGQQGHSAAGCDMASEIGSIDRLPKFAKVLSIEDESCREMIGRFGEKMAVLEVGEKSVHLIAIGETFCSGQFYSLESKLQSSGFRVIGKSKVRVALFEQIQKAAHAAIPTKHRRRQNPRFETPEEKAQIHHLFEEVVGVAIEAPASDIHIEIRFDAKGESVSKVKLRVDGLIKEVAVYRSDLLRQMVYYAFMEPSITDKESRSDPVFKERANQSCTMHVCRGEERISFRYQHLSCKGGFDVVMRVLAEANQNGLVTLQSLGYSKSQEYQLRLAERKTLGAIFVAGVTSSGKTTTLKTLLGLDPERNSRKKTYTVEDPPEYLIPGATQVAVQRNNDKHSKEEISAFAAVMKDIVRADPDRILVGEVRDKDSGEMLQTMIQSGHQVFASVHAMSGFDVIERLSSPEIGLRRETLTSANFISALVYQRLLPKSCPHCKVPATKVLPETTLEVIRTKFGLDPSKMFCRSNTGCPKCNGRSTAGRTVCAEVILWDLDLWQMLRAGDDIGALLAWRRRRTASFDSADCRYKTAFEHALYKMSIGIVDPRDVEGEFEPFELYKVIEVETKSKHPAKGKEVTDEFSGQAEASASPKDFSAAAH